MRIAHRAVDELVLTEGGCASASAASRGAPAPSQLSSSRTMDVREESVRAVE
jgi:hypothetical protein